MATLYGPDGRPVEIGPDGESQIPFLLSHGWTAFAPVDPNATAGAYYGFDPVGMGGGDGTDGKPQPGGGMWGEIAEAGGSALGFLGGVGKVVLGGVETVNDFALKANTIISPTSSPALTDEQRFKALAGEAAVAAALGTAVVAGPAIGVALATSGGGAAKAVMGLMDEPDAYDPVSVEHTYDVAPYQAASEEKGVTVGKGLNAEDLRKAADMGLQVFGAVTGKPTTGVQGPGPVSIAGAVRTWSSTGQGVTGGQLADGRLFAVRRNGTVKYYRPRRNTDRARLRRIVRQHKADTKLLTEIARAVGLGHHAAPAKSGKRRK